ncbi:hypothetical protein D0Z08_05870 [Nocardioides immobilis]|uniref:Uncharacterized protein n=1 Tax=Nocardioides immobilis TaxID=2049295 RepID=A0A417Y5Q1_9ACTN|nr:hypothetical protein [Nocardioides immobilis]RHW27824.1 hypothetical protein D0Z08_05870 [Nocardioides immobilis]
MRIDPDRVFRDFMLDVFGDVCAAQWRARAEEFRAARPRPGDYLGASTVEDRREQWRRLTAIAEACEARARFIAAGHVEFPEVEAFRLSEAA